VSETPEATFERHRARLPRPLQLANPTAVGLAIQQADGDWHRVAVEPDGSVMVHNRPVNLGVGSDMPPVRREPPPEPPRRPDLLDHFREPT
jgi:hypothetical protein